MKKSNKNRRIILYVISAIIAIIALYYINYSDILITGSTITNNVSKYDYSREGNPEYYSLLPPKPDDFDEIKLMLLRGIISDDIERINESYWKQPEWFPFYKESFLDPIEDTVRTNRIPIWSLGIYDAQIYRQINKKWLSNPTEIPEKQTRKGFVEIKNNSIIVKQRFWIRAAPPAVKHYGVGLKIIYPDKALLKGNPNYGISRREVTQNPNTTQQYMKAWVEPKEFTLGTYFPKLSPDYVKQVWISVEISKDTPKGSYIIGVDAGAPSKEYQEEQSLKYGLAYTDPSIGMAVYPAEFRLFIDVV
ncbi:MAG: hypothetical protein ACTSWZ_07385 [Candidatus Heimdallarchaeaceae archaeon]